MPTPRRQSNHYQKLLMFSWTHAWSFKLLPDIPEHQSVSRGLAVQQCRHGARCSDLDLQHWATTQHRGLRGWSVVLILQYDHKHVGQKPQVQELLQSESEVDPVWEFETKPNGAAWNKVSVHVEHAGKPTQMLRGMLWQNIIWDTRLTFTAAANDDDGGNNEDGDKYNDATENGAKEEKRLVGRKRRRENKWGGERVK